MTYNMTNNRTNDLSQYMLYDPERDVHYLEPTPNPLEYLARLNAHPRDSRIEFDEGPHVYTIDGDPSVVYTSVTTLNHEHFEQFDADLIISRMMSSQRWPASKYFGMSVEEIKAQWNANGLEASTAGTKLHLDIEYHYNGAPYDNQTIEYEYFKQFAAAHVHMTPYRTEWCVFNEQLRISGSIDMIFENPDGTLSIYDWKRSKEIVKTSPWMKFATTPEIDHLPDTNYWHYSLQLNTYKYLIESKYDKMVKDMYLVCLHPNNKNGSYQKIHVPDLSTEVGDLMRRRARKLSLE